MGPLRGKLKRLAASETIAGELAHSRDRSMATTTRRQWMRGISATAGINVLRAAPASLKTSGRATVSFDSSWRFLKADASGAEQPGFDDTAWRALDVPHDWSIEGPFDENNPTGGAGGYLPAGVGWYRKRFTLPESDSGRCVFLDFDGVMANSDVWINGAHLGRRPYGYVSFRYELTPHLRFGASQPNVIGVRADNSAQPASRWYAGAGLYRHVRLVVTDPVHLGHWATFVTTPRVERAQATVHVSTAVVNQSGAPREAAIEVTLLSPGGRTAATATSAARSIAAGQSEPFECELKVTNPVLWDLDRGALYRAITRVKAGRAILDEETTTFGIRDFRFEPETGFWLNGRNFKIKGVCLHHECGGLGAAVPSRAWERRFGLLKELGVNAVRTAHNPPAPEFLDLCDRVGLMVMDEMFDCWTVAKNSYDYHLYFNDWSAIDTRDTVLRDRNHPSIVVYSAGNEIHDTPKADLAKRILTGLRDTFHRWDPTRPVSQGLFRPNVSHDYDNGLADLLDVVGQNYRENEILAAHRAKPSRKILGTENTHDRAAWLALRDNPAYAGQFLWSGIDYLGEARRWPTVGAGSGLLDRTGRPKPLGFQRQSWWSDKPMVHIARRIVPPRLTPSDPGYEPLQRPQEVFCNWNPASLEPHEENVEVYSNCEQVELWLNGKSLGAKPRPADDAPRVWQVPFEPGTVKAVGSNGGKVVASHELRTAGRPAKILLAADRTRLAAHWEDVSYITATVADDKGAMVPDAADLVVFQVSGAGRIAAVDNGDNRSHEPFQASERRAYQGQCVAVVRATSPGGKITVQASSPGLAGATVVLETTPR
jgi:beta-galactosidase